MSLTGATAVIQLSIAGLFPTPQQLQGFAADDVFDTDAIESAEVLMGVDGIMSAGFVFVPVPQTYTLQADSPSVFIFDQWWAAQQAAEDTFPASGVVYLTAIGAKYNMTNGVLTSWKPTPDVKKLLQPRKFRITWQRIFPTLS